MTPPKLPEKLENLLLKTFPDSCGTAGKDHRGKATTIATELWEEILKLRKTLSIIEEDFSEARERDLDIAIEDLQDCRVCSSSALKQSQERWGK